MTPAEQRQATIAAIVDSFPPLQPAQLAAVASVMKPYLRPAASRRTARPARIPRQRQAAA